MSVDPTQPVDVSREKVIERFDTIGEELASIDREIRTANLIGLAGLVGKSEHARLVVIIRNRLSYVGDPTNE